MSEIKTKNKITQNSTWVLLGCFLLYVLLENNDLVKPPQYHEPPSQIPTNNISFVQPVIIGTASVAPDTTWGYNLTSGSIPTRRIDWTALMATSGSVSPII